jgi:hypothetical protein
MQDKKCPFNLCYMCAVPHVFAVAAIVCQAMRDANLHQERFWLVQSSDHHNRTGKVNTHNTPYTYHN